MHRPIVRVFLGVSLDGCIAGRDHDLSWLECVSTDPPEDTGYADLMAKTDALLMGRNTYDAIANFDPWPFEGKRCLVMTHGEIDDDRVECANGTLPDLLSQLGDEGVHGVYLDGGSIVRQGLAEGLVDELTLSWVPMILGEGVRLFDGLPEFRQRWTLTRSRSFPSGLVQATYRPVSDRS
ncbi:MAG: dihydrofolate reductase [Methanoregulaceae archaeon]|nr:dihydrofolate reductase [Methanoregulaceae archaeon]